MIALQLGIHFLDLPPDNKLSIEVLNPVFDFERIPGIAGYAIDLPLTQHNCRVLNQVHATGVVGARTRNYSDLTLWVKGCPWRTGTLRVLGGSAKVVRVSFDADSADVAHKIKGVKLADIDFGQAAFNLSVQPAYPASTYALFPVHNPGFYNSDAPDFTGYVNYYRDNNFKLNTGGLTLNYAYTPFPYLVWVIEKVFEHFGYTVSGSFIADTDVQRFVVYSNQDFNNAEGSWATVQGTIDFAKLMPDLTIAEFFIALRKLFALAFNFDVINKNCEIKPLRDVATSAAFTDRSPKTLVNPTWEPYQQTGYVLRQEADNSDKTLRTDLELQLGEGGMDITAKGGTLFSSVITDSEHPTRAWLVPQADQPGTTQNFGVEGQPAKQLRLLNYFGLQQWAPSSDTYPLGSSSNKNAMSQVLGNYSLHWVDGQYGLYDKWHKPWLDLLSTGQPEQCEQRLNIVDFLNLKPFRKEMVQGQLYLWQKIQLQVSQRGLANSKVSYLNITHA